MSDEWEGVHWVKIIGKPGQECRSGMLKPNVDAAPRLRILSTLKIEAKHLPETSLFSRPTQRHIQEDDDPPVQSR
jgi:hypothetical protein